MAQALHNTDPTRSGQRLLRGIVGGTIAAVALAGCASKPHKEVVLAGKVDGTTVCAKPPVPTAIQGKFTAAELTTVKAEAQKLQLETCTGAFALGEKVLQTYNAQVTTPNKAVTAKASADPDAKNFEVQIIIKQDNGAERGVTANFALGAASLPNLKHLTDVETWVTSPVAGSEFVTQSARVDVSDPTNWVMDTLNVTGEAPVGAAGECLRPVDTSNGNQESTYTQPTVATLQTAEQAIKLNYQIMTANLHSPEPAGLPAC